MSPAVGIIDYGAGNVQSVANAFNKLGANAFLVSNPEKISSCRHLVLPGVGAFSGAIESLIASGMSEALNNYIRNGYPILGICLGMQLMCIDSMEDGMHTGLGWIDAHVLPFSTDEKLKVPHMGWNAVKKIKESPIVEDVVDSSDVYFVHSYYVQCNNPDDVLLSCDYGKEFVAGFAHEHIYGLQFHPEKSQATGLKMLENFLKL